MKFKVAAALCLGLLTASRSYAACPEIRCPLPLEEDDPEIVKVTGPRIPKAGPGIIDLGTIVVAPPIYVASADQVNANGKSKIEKAKQESRAGKSNFWTITTLKSLLSFVKEINLLRRHILLRFHKCNRSVIVLPMQPAKTSLPGPFLARYPELSLDELFRSLTCCSL